NLRRVVIEENILNVGLELLLGAHAGGGHGNRRWSVDRNCGRGVGRSTVAGGCQVISRRLARGHRLYARAGNRSHTVIDGNTAGVGGLPLQRDLVTGGDDRGGGGELRGGGRRGRWRRGGGRRRRRLLLAAGHGKQGGGEHNGQQNAATAIQ